MKNFPSDDYYAPEDGSPAVKGSNTTDQFSNFVAFDENNQLESFLDDDVGSPRQSKSTAKLSLNCSCFDGLKEKLKKKRWAGGIHMAILITFLVLASAASMATLVFTFMQVAPREKTNMSELIAEDDKTSACELVQYHPLRFRIIPDPQYLQCSWNTKNNIHRVIWSLVGLFLPLLAVFALRKNKKFVMWIFGLLSLVLAGLFFYVMAIDADSVRKSNSWCNSAKDSGELSGLKTKPTGKIQCGYWPYISTCFADAIAFLIWFSLVIISIRYARKNMDKKVSMFTDSL